MFKATCSHGCESLHTDVILQFVLIQVIDVERLPALSQDLLLLLPLSLFLGTSSALTLCWSDYKDTRQSDCNMFKPSSSNE